MYDLKHGLYKPLYRLAQSIVDLDFMLKHHPGTPTTDFVCSAKELYFTEYIKLSLDYARYFTLDEVKRAKAIFFKMYDGNPHLPPRNMAVLDYAVFELNSVAAALCT